MNQEKAEDKISKNLDGYINRFDKVSEAVTSKVSTYLINELTKVEKSGENLSALRSKLGQKITSLGYEGLTDSLNRSIDEAFKARQDYFDEFGEVEIKKQDLTRLSAINKKAIAGIYEGKLKLTTDLKSLLRKYEAGNISFDDTVLKIQANLNTLQHRAYTIANTSIMAGDRRVTTAIGEEIGVKYYKYVGQIIEGTREFCRMLLGGINPATKEANPLGNKWTVEQINQMNNEQGLNVLDHGGGYNCQHSWMPVLSDVKQKSVKGQTKTVSAKEAVQEQVKETRQDVSTMSKIDQRKAQLAKIKYQEFDKYEDAVKWAKDNYGVDIVIDWQHKSQPDYIKTTNEINKGLHWFASNNPSIDYSRTTIRIANIIGKGQAGNYELAVGGNKTTPDKISIHPIMSEGGRITTVTRILIHELQHLKEAHISYLKNDRLYAISKDILKEQKKVKSILNGIGKSYEELSEKESKLYREISYLEYTGGDTDKINALKAEALEANKRKQYINGLRYSNPLDYSTRTYSDKINGVNTVVASEWATCATEAKYASENNPKEYSHRYDSITDADGNKTPLKIYEYLNEIEKILQEEYNK